MKNISTLLMALAATLVMGSFRNTTEETIIGTYGLCACNNGSEKERIMLNLQPDHTFSYVDNTVPGKIIRTHGRWEATGKKGFILKDYPKNLSIYNKWRYDGDCIKARNGMNFRRICRMEKCE